MHLPCGHPSSGIAFSAELTWNKKASLYPDTPPQSSRRRRDFDETSRKKLTGDTTGRLYRTPTEQLCLSPILPAGRKPDGRLVQHDRLYTDNSQPHRIGPGWGLLLVAFSSQFRVWAASGVLWIDSAGAQYDHLGSDSGGCCPGLHPGSPS